MRQKIKNKSLDNSTSSITDSNYLIEKNYNKINRKNKRRISLKRGERYSEVFSGYKQKLNKNIEFLQEEELQKIKTENAINNDNVVKQKKDSDIKDLEENNQKFIDDNFCDINYDDYNDNNDNENNSSSNNDDDEKKINNVENVIDDTTINNDDISNENSLDNDNDEEINENDDENIINEDIS